MQDIVEKVDRLKVLAASIGSGERADQLAGSAEVIGIAFDFIGELVANSRRSAVALEKIATQFGVVTVERDPEDDQ